jgi:hypothetical protein
MWRKNVYECKVNVGNELLKGIFDTAVLHKVTLSIVK